MSKVAIVYWSGTGNTEAMANYVAEGVKKAGGEADLFTSAEFALFGSYGWGDGEWMRTWESDCMTLGVTMACEPVICNATPDEAAGAECEALGEALANA